MLSLCILIVKNPLGGSFFLIFMKVVSLQNNPKLVSFVILDFMNSIFFSVGMPSFSTYDIDVMAIVLTF